MQKAHSGRDDELEAKEEKANREGRGTLKFGCWMA
jgi:hypothetical protein